MTRVLEDYRMRRQHGDGDDAQVRERAEGVIVALRRCTAERYEWGALSPRSPR